VSHGYKQIAFICVKALSLQPGITMHAVLTRDVPLRKKPRKKSRSRICE